jgi:uncharacterized repeat protein (TIGR02543 family)
MLPVGWSNGVFEECKFDNREVVPMAVLASAVMPCFIRLARYALTVLVLCVSQQVAAATSPPADYLLTVSKSGAGTVTSAPGGINCGATCSATYASGSYVTLMAASADGNSFVGWSGACKGKRSRCRVSMKRARSVGATFTQNSPTISSYSLSVAKSGSGTVISSPSGINCGSTCSATYASGTAVTLTATAATGYSFAGWSGGCSGTSTGCTVSMTAARSVTATFSQVISNATTLAWDPPVASTNPAGYRLYFGSAPGTYQQPYGQGISVGNVTTYTLMGLSSGTYYFAATAVDSLGKESAYSNEAFKDIP